MRRQCGGASCAGCFSRKPSVTLGSCLRAAGPTLQDLLGRLRRRPRTLGQSQQTLRFSSTYASDDGSRVYGEDQLVIDNWGAHPPVLKTGEVDLAGGRPRTLRIQYVEAIMGASLVFEWKKLDPRLLRDAVQTAKAADVAVVAVGDSEGDESEGLDRPSLELPHHQAELVQAVAQANPRTVVVLSAGSPVEIGKFLAHAPSVLMSWFPGQEAGHALVDLLLSESSPSGRLPVTWPKRREDAADHGRFPGSDDRVKYDEDILIGSATSTRIR